MISYLNDSFIHLFGNLPNRVKRNAQKNYKLWKENPSYPSLDFKKVHLSPPTYSIRIGIGWRALGVKDENIIVWYWIGSHSEYDKLLKQL